jgi:hypothetical protein
LTAFDEAILIRRKHLSHQAGMQFPTAFSPQVKRKIGAYLSFVSDFYSKSDSEKDRVIAGFSDLPQKYKMTALGEHWREMDEAAKKVFKTKAEKDSDTVDEDNAQYLRENAAEIERAAQLIKGTKTKVENKLNPDFDAKAEKLKLKEKAAKEKEKAKASAKAEKEKAKKLKLKEAKELKAEKAANTKEKEKAKKLKLKEAKELKAEKAANTKEKEKAKKLKLKKAKELKAEKSANTKEKATKSMK